MPHKKLSTDALAQESLRFMRQNQKAFLRIAGPLVFLWMTTALLANWWQARSAFPLPIGHTTITLIEAAFTVLWFRLSLQGQFPISYSPTRYSSANHLDHHRSKIPLARVILRSLFLVIGISAMVTPVAIAVAIGLTFIKALAGIPFNTAKAPALVMTSITIAMFLFSPLLCRLLPYYAAMASGNYNFTPLAAWRATRGNSLRLWWLCVRLTAPWIILSYMLERLMAVYMKTDGLANLPGLAVQNLITASLSLVAIAIMASGVAAAMAQLPLSEQNIHI